MKMKKIALLGVSIALVLAVMNSCRSSHTNDIENNNTELGSESFTGSTFSSILKGLENGMLSETVSEAMGNFLVILDSEDPGNDGEIKALEGMDNKLLEISNELRWIEEELETILTDIKVSEDSIKNPAIWPQDAIDNITTTTQALQKLGVDNGTKVKPGEGNHTRIAELASDILGAKYDIPSQVNSIYDGIMVNPTPLLSNYVDQVMLKLANNDNVNLQKAYTGFEYYTSELLDNQLRGVNLVIEAFKAQDDNSTAQEYLDSFVANDLHSEISDFDNNSSFIHNAISLVLRDAPIHDPFLPTSAESILKRAEFYRLLMTGTDHEKFGLRFLYISTADMPKDLGPVFAFNEESRQIYGCEFVHHHTIQGKAYASWENEDDYVVTPRTDYNVVEYRCGNVPNGTYKITVQEDPSGNSFEMADVTQYDTDYNLNSSGTISYGFALFTDNNITNYFTESSERWSVQKHTEGKCRKEVNGGANSWPLEAFLLCYDDGNPDSIASIELDGHFYYDSDAEERTMYAYWDAKFHTQATSPGGFWCPSNDAYSYYYVGVWDGTAGNYASSDCKNKTYHRLHASSGFDYSSDHHVADHCSFTAKPGHQYYVYFKMVAETNSPSGGGCGDPLSATSKLYTVDSVYLEF